ncbi:OmpA family protein [Roseomonas elaeocarpi]|uniref:OmpA family protein n=1 Tax=Roseomonas elaeocarpi TaxID=907779 RepID=A0ABV6JU94_9PROT
MSFRKALLAATVVSLPLAAQAQPVSGVYIAGGGGANWVQSTRNNVDDDSSFLVRSGLPNDSLKAKYELGFGGVLSVGYGFGNGLRLEAEGDYRQNDIDDIQLFGVRGYGIGGTQRTYGAMGNVFYDFALPSFIPQYLPVVPYIGAGVGYQWTDINNGNARFGTNSRIHFDDRDGQFAYQGIAGLAFPIAAVPGLSVTAEYRFLGTLSPDLNASIERVNAAGQPVATLARTKVELDNFNHSAFLGLRYAFNAPRPAPAPVPPVATPAPQETARTYLVFFDWDRSDLTDRARQIIAEAAQNSRSGGVTRLEVSGHADRSGTPQYNQRLSQRRADTVAAELARNGVARSQMTVQAFGESRPLVATADGVREPQNRRVEIVLR